MLDLTKFGNESDRYQVVRVVGDNNLQKCLEDYDLKGFDAFSIVFCGLVPIRSSPLSAEMGAAPLFTVVMKKRYDA